MRVETHKKKSPSLQALVTAVEKSPRFIQGCVSKWKLNQFMIELWTLCTLCKLEHIIQLSPRDRVPPPENSVWPKHKQEVLTFPVTARRVCLELLHLGRSNPGSPRRCVGLSSGNWWLTTTPRSEDFATTVPEYRAQICLVCSSFFSPTLLVFGVVIHRLWIASLRTSLWLVWKKKETVFGVFSVAQFFRVGFFGPTCVFYFYSALLPRAASEIICMAYFLYGVRLIPRSRHLSSKHFPCRDFHWAFLNELIHLRLDLFNAGDTRPHHTSLQELTKQICRVKRTPFFPGATPNTIIILTQLSAALVRNLQRVIPTLSPVWITPVRTSPEIHE